MLQTLGLQKISGYENENLKLLTPGGLDISGGHCHSLNVKLTKTHAINSQCFLQKM